jgi:hypothetical protein
MERQLAINRGRSYTASLDTLGLESSVQVTVAKAWEVLPAVYHDFGLDINFREPEAQRLGTCYQDVRNRLGKVPLSTFIDCGEDRGMASADRYEIQLTVLTTVKSAPNGETSLFTFVLGVGRDPSSSTNRRWCYSQGVLESRIKAGVEAKSRA